MASAHRSNPRIDVRSRPQAWRAYRRILQYIRAKGLHTGDRLPTQPELCRSLGLCTNTLKAAMDALVSHGVLQSRRKIGTVIVDEAAITRTPWTIGLTAGRVEDDQPASFYAELTVRLLGELGKANCRSEVYHRQWRFTPVPLDEFAGLTESIDQGRLDGLIVLMPIVLSDWRKAERAGVPICCTHRWIEAPCAVLVDEAAMAEQAALHLSQRGCRRIAATALVGRDIAPGEFWTGFDRGIARAGRGVHGESLSVGKMLAIPEFIDQNAPALAQQLLSRPASKRPDGLIIGDDYIASQLTALLRDAGGYRPKIAVKTNRHVVRHFALPIDAFEVDPQQLAARTVSLLLERIWNPQSAARVEWHVPRLVQPSPAKALAPLAV